ncbi:unnamed protein product [Rotaria magnacalcarata]|uniref:Uncharacterized protein n=1 Tax=Rotaria magnacalcarata TaxID=392030 RepID=A0A816C6A1_9BILA|nr:unnamed protein product [Rotaria magnacalcarata]CAF1648767.1 unnamed protein product [Rotaria magnacalcarata]
MASRGFRFSKSSDTSTSYTTVRNINLTVTTTGLIDEDNNSSKDEISTTSNGDPFNLEFISSTTTSQKNPVIFTPSRVSDFFGYESSSGIPLNHSLYYNFDQMSAVDGYLLNITLRLFASWEGDDPLYIFAVSAYFLQHEIIHRYPVMPETNNTEWQTIEISFRSFPVFKNTLLAIGMQTSSPTNRIYAVRSTMSIRGKDITDSKTQFIPRRTESFYGIAFTYTAIEDGKRISYKT